MKLTIFLILVVISLLTGASKLQATEGGLGRPISGASINPYAGLVPPLPGFAIGVTEAYYDASLGGSTTVPIGTNLALGVDMTVSFTPITILYIWPTHSAQWNFASAINFPLADVQAEATVTVGRFTRRVKDDTFGLFDIGLVPIVASYHISETDHIAFNLVVWIPSGDYDPDRLANLGTNTWTIIPGVAYTKLFPKANVEMSASWGLLFDTENTATNYQNGVLSDLEATVIKRFKCGCGVGIIGSWIQQVSDDQGTTAERLDGFVGRALGAGPILTYSTKLGKSNLDFNARWVHEFDSQKRPQGDLFQIAASLKF